jgi:Flp pilus assembly protein TadD
MQISVEQAMPIAIQHHQAGRLAEAEQFYRQVLVEQPNHPDALHLLGILFAQQGKHEPAVELIGRAIAVNPTTVVFHSNLANVLREMGRPQDAIAPYREAMRLNPNSPKDMVNLAAALRESGDPVAAMKECMAAFKIKPDLPELHHEMGIARLENGDIDGATRSLGRAIALSPHWPEPHWNLSIALLLKGDYRQGWIEHEFRLQMKEFAGAVLSDKSKWDGADLKGRTVLLTPELGYGNMIQFVRYVPLIGDRGGKAVILRQPALGRVFEGIPNLTVLETLTSESFDLYCPVASLPMAFATRLKSIPADIPYVLPDGDLVDALGSKIDASTGKTRIGVAWVAPPSVRNDHSRSISLSQLAPLNAAEGVEFYALQTRPSPPAENPSDELQMIDPPLDIKDLADTAALISWMDVVISVDSAVAHLAGAMGKTVWLLIPTQPDWRWLPGREDNPWYPTMRIFRQKTRGEWSEVVGRVASALGEFAKAHRGEERILDID